MPDHVIVIGDACVDVTVAVAELTKYGEADAKLAEKFAPALAGGGTSANTAVALRKLGVPTAFMGTIGADFGGRFLLKEFRDYDINTEFVITDDSNTVYVFAFIDASGERTLWSFPREDVSYCNLDLARIDLEKVKHAAWMHASGMAYMMDGSTRKNLPELFRVAYEAGVPTSFDLNTRAGSPETLEPAIRDAVMATLPYVRYLLGSAKDEFYSFCPHDDWHDSVRAFAKPGRTVISRMGGEGVFAVYDGIEEFQMPYDVPVKNTTGAGDAFNAGFIAAILHGCTVSEAILRGSAVAGYKIATGGARCTPDMQQLLNFMETAQRKQKK